MKQKDETHLPSVLFCWLPVFDHFGGFSVFPVRKVALVFLNNMKLCKMMVQVLLGDIFEYKSTFSS
uniref:Ovule protein n=1 Tax=Heterorhabditis bacteriophora TaxID=37862 RepID=A0A1I7XQK0_HETBA